MEYTAEVAVRANRPLKQDTLMDLAAIGGVATGTPGTRRAEATLTVRANSVVTAAQMAIDKVTAVVPGDVILITIMTTQEADRRLAEPAPRIVGVFEVAQLLGVTKQRLAVLRERSDFPAPIATLAVGPIWREGDLSTFAGGWQRRPGRPRKVIEENKVAENA